MKAIFVSLWIVTLAGAMVGVPGAAASDEAPLLAAWAQALGGQEALASFQAYRTRYAVKMFGLDGTLQEWVDAGGRHRIELDLGGMFHIEQVYDGQDGWTLDQNGKVSRMSGTNLAGEITSIYEATFSHLVPDRMPGTIEALGKSADGKFDLVAITPAGGHRVTWSLDPESHLPVQSERPADERTQKTTYSDWQRFGGVLFAGTQQTSTGDPHYDTSFALQEVEIGLKVSDHTFAKPAEAADDVHFTQGQAVENIPIEFNTVHVFVPVVVREKPLWFVLDTGAGATVLNEATARELGLELTGSIEGRGAGAHSVDVKLVKDVSVEVKGATTAVTVSGQTVAAIDLAPIEALMGRQFDGVLGYDFISRFAIVIDYQGKRLHLYDRRGWEYTGSGTIVPLRLEHNLPHVRLALSLPGGTPIEGEVLVDTGAGTTASFTKPFADKHDAVGKLRKKIDVEGGFGVGGVSRSVMGRVDRLELGGLPFEQPICGFSRDEAGAGANPDRMGLIGGELLRRATVIFDYERERMILEPNADFGAPFRMDGLGILWTSGGRGKWHELSVRGTVAGLPAAKAGLQPGDRLVSVDERTADQLTVHDLWGMFRDKGRKVRLVVERDGKRIEKKLETTAAL